MLFFNFTLEHRNIPGQVDNCSNHFQDATEAKFTGLPQKMISHGYHFLNV